MKFLFNRKFGTHFPFPRCGKSPRYQRVAGPSTQSLSWSPASILASLSPSLAPPQHFSFASFSPYLLLFNVQFHRIEISYPLFVSKLFLLAPSLPNFRRLSGLSASSFLTWDLEFCSSNRVFVLVTRLTWFRCPIAYGPFYRCYLVIFLRNPNLASVQKLLKC